MPELTRAGQAGTFESNDIVVTIAPAERGAGINISLQSPVVNQYGARIREVIQEVLIKAGISDARVDANDRGALDCTIRARMAAALERALREEMRP